MSRLNPRPDPVLAEVDRLERWLADPASVRVDRRLIGHTWRVRKHFRQTWNITVGWHLTRRGADRAAVREARRMDGQA